MKLQMKVLIAALALACPAAYLVAQDSSQPQPPPHHRPPGGPDGRRMGPPPGPLFNALDANHDGVIDSSEIDNAPAALRTLDKNGDGKLTMDELRPPRPDGRGPGGPGGPGEDNPPAPSQQQN